MLTPDIFNGQPYGFFVPLTPSAGHPMDYRKPTSAQANALTLLAGPLRSAYDAIEAVLPASPEKAEALKLIRTARMWANCAAVFAPDDALPLPEVKR